LQLVGDFLQAGQGAPSRYRAKLRYVPASTLAACRRRCMAAQYVKEPTKRKPTVEKFQPPQVWALIPRFEEITIGNVRD
jgi:hypothetical protein